MDVLPIIDPSRPGPAGRIRRALLDRVGERWESRYHRLTQRVATAIYASTRGEMPRSIEIETVNRCNGRCAFCPVNARNDPRPSERMEMARIERIVAELAEADYRGDIALFSNNEPLLDPRLVEICAMVRRQVPRAWIYIYTNGTLLTAEVYDGLFEAGLDELVVNNYSDAMAPHPAAARLIEALRARPEGASRGEGRTRILLRRETEVLSSRAGTAPNKNASRSAAAFARSSCSLPFVQMVIRPSGEVSLCCQDAFGRVTLGDLRKQTIREIWNGEGYERLRRTLQREGRRALDLCRDCDAHLLQPWVLRRMIGR